MNRKNILAIAAIVLLAAVLFGILSSSARKEGEQNRRVAEAAEKARPLEIELAGLVHKKEQLDQTYAVKSAEVNTAHEQLLFVSLDERLYTETYPQLAVGGYPGVLLLSEDELPGMVGKITESEFNELLAAGWTTAAACPNSEELQSWYERFRSLLEERGLTMPEVIFFTNADYSIALDEQLSAYGFTVVIHHGEHELEYSPMTADEGIWRIGCYQWNFSGAKDYIQWTVNSRANMVYCISFDENRNDAYYPTNFQNMLDYVHDFVKDEQLVFDSPAEALVSYRESAPKKEAVMEERDMELSALEQQIEVLQRQISELYRSVNN